MKQVLIIGGSPLDTSYSHDFGDGLGEINWNVTRVLKAIERGEFGAPIHWPWAFPPVDPRADENVDRQKVEFMKTRPDILKIPVVAVQGKDLGPETLSIECFIDGNHRMVAMAELGYQGFDFYLIPREMEKSFRMSILVRDLP